MQVPALLVVACLLKEVQSLIRASGAQTAEYGGEVHYSCSVTDLPGVLQITWQRQFKDASIENLATYSKRFGQQVNKPNRWKVAFAEASLSSTAIAVKNVTWIDESCYICSFHVYPDGTSRKKSCLTVEGISDVTTVAHPSTDRGAEVTFTCSATGKPSPTLRWEPSTPDLHYSQSQTSTAVNSDSTFTTSSNITLQAPAGWDGYVDCLVNSGRTGERRERIPISLDAGNKEKDKGKTYPWSHLVPIFSAVVLMFCVIAAVMALRKRRLKRINRHEVIS